MVEKKVEESKVRIGEVREIKTCDPYTGKEIVLNIVVLEIFITMQCERRVDMATCRFTYGGSRFSMPITNLQKLDKVESDFEV